MKRHPVLLVVVVGVLLAVAVLGARKDSSLLVLDWAAKAPADRPPVAVLIDMGLKDTAPTAWSGRATVNGARIVHREGYRFRRDDKLIDPDGWEASSNRPIRVPPRNPAVARAEGIASVGIVLHLADVKDDGALILQPKDDKREKATVSLNDVLAGQRQTLWNGAAVVRLVTTATPVVTTGTEDDFPAAAYAPDGTLWVAYISYTLKDEERRIEPPQLKGQPASFKSLDRPDFGDQLFVKSYRGGKWGEPVAVTGAKEDLVRCAIAVEAGGDVIVTYSAHRKDSFDLYSRTLRAKAGQAGAPELGPEVKLTETPGPHLGPVACTDQGGQVHVASHSRPGRPAEAGDKSLPTTLVVAHRTLGKDRAGAGGTELAGERKWHPALAAGPDGRVALAYDTYAGDYDVHVREWKDGRLGPEIRVAASSRFEARPSLAYDPQGRLWIAYDDGPEQWGKDFGALDEEGNPLYNNRQVRVACLQDGRLYRPVAELPKSASKQKGPDERTPRYAYPKIGVDGKGRVWLTYREKFGTRYTTHPGSYWLTFARRLDGDRWTEPIEVHHSDGLLDSRPVLLPHAGGGLLIVHNTDGRYTTPETIDNQIYCSVVDLPGEPKEPKLEPHEPGQKDGDKAAEEKAAVARIRGHRLKNGSHTYQLLRGEFHRHTEISWDGGPDGSLEDMFRYALDAVAFDWIGNTDHDNGAGREYPWWLTQKLTDAYHVAKSFTPLFAYERSVSYPHGHRNVIFAKRGVMTLPRLAEADPDKRVAGVHADDAKMLFRYLRELGGICASHTSATSMGTDWRDNDPQVEPIVEIYQGDRNSYEYPDAPRAGHDPKSNKLPASLGGWQPAGFIDNAFKTGYRLGFQSSSDHFSTHISFCIVLAESFDREGILDAMRKRHCYGATDNIIMDVRSGSRLMGEEFQAETAPALQVHVIGTKSLARLDVIRDSTVVQTLQPGTAEYKGEWTDPKPEAGVHYYYVRVQQSDGELAWSSPMWIDYRK